MNVPTTTCRMFFVDCRRIVIEKFLTSFVVLPYAAYLLFVDLSSISQSKRKIKSNNITIISSKDVANTNMNTIQAKLQECINSGQLNSFDRLSNLFAGKSETDADNDAMETNIPLKDESKIPAKKSSSKKHPMTGMYGDKRSKKVNEKKFRKERTAAGSSSSGSRGRSASRMDSRAKRSSSKKGKKMATI